MITSRENAERNEEMLKKYPNLNSLKRKRWFKALSFDTESEREDFFRTLSIALEEHDKYILAFKVPKLNFPKIV